MRITTIVTLSVISISLAACGGSIPPPNDEMIAANTDVGAAEAGGAPAVPDAKLHLELAEEDLRQSKTYMNEDNKRAASLIALAKVEAQLALSLAKEIIAQQVAQKAQADVVKAKGGS